MKSSLFHRFCEHPGPTLANGRQFGRRIVDPIEARLLPLLEKGVGDFDLGGQMITFSNAVHLFEKTTGRDRLVNLHSSKFKGRTGPQKAKRHERKTTVVRTRLQTFAKHLRRLQPQGDCFFGATLADVSDKSIAKLMTRLTK